MSKHILRNHLDVSLLSPYFPFTLVLSNFSIKMYYREIAIFTESLCAVKSYWFRFVYNIIQPSIQLKSCLSLGTILHT